MKRQHAVDFDGLDPQRYTRVTYDLGYVHAQDGTVITSSGQPLGGFPEGTEFRAPTEAERAEFERQGIFAPKAKSSHK